MDRAAVIHTPPPFKRKKATRKALPRGPACARIHHGRRGGFDRAQAAMARHRMPADIWRAGGAACQLPQIDSDYYVAASVHTGNHIFRGGRRGDGRASGVHECWHALARLHLCPVFMHVGFYKASTDSGLVCLCSSVQVQSREGEVPRQ